MASGSDIRAGKAFVELYTRNSALIRGLDQAQRRLRDFGNSVSMVGKYMAGLGAAALAPLAAMVSRFESVGSALNDMAARTGMSVEALSEFKYAAEQSGAELGDMEISIKRMQKSIASATDGPLAKLKGMRPEEQFARIAETLKAIRDPAERTRAAMEIFGKSGTALLPMIADLDSLRKRARELGAVMSTEDAKAADTFGDALGDLKAAILGAGNGIASALIPKLTQFVNEAANAAASVKRWVTSHSDLIITLAETAIKLVAVGAAIYAVGKAFTTVAALIGATRAGFLFFANPANVVAITALTAAVTALAIAWGEVARRQAEANANMATGKRIGSHTKLFEEGIKDNDPTKTQAAIAEWEKEVATARHAYAAARQKAAADFDKESKLNLGWGTAETDKGKDAYIAANTDVEAKRLNLAQAEILLKRYKEMQREWQAPGPHREDVGFLRTPGRKMFDDLVAWGVQTGKDFAANFWKSFVAQAEALQEFREELAKVKAQGIADPQKRDEALANLEYAAKARAIQKDVKEGKVPQEALAINERTRQQELENIRNEYARRAKEKQEQDAREMAEKRKAIEEGAVKDLEELRIETTKTGHDKELALLKLRQQRELEEAQKTGANLAVLKEKQELEQRALGMGLLGGAGSAATVTFSASAAMGAGGGVQERIAKACEKTFTFIGEQTSVLKNIEKNQVPLVMKG